MPNPGAKTYLRELSMNGFAADDGAKDLVKGKQLACPLTHNTRIGLADWEPQISSVLETHCANALRFSFAS